MNSLLIIILVFAIITFIGLVGMILFYILANNVSFSRIKENIKRNLRQKRINEQERENFILNLTETLIRLSNKKTGALIICEQRNSLSIYQDSGFKINAKFDIEFVTAVFSNKDASFHDGAIIVSDTYITAISCYVPITKEASYSKHGARHRAALGISEITDAISFVVSETNGRISFAFKGELASLGKNHKEITENLKKLI